MSPQRAPCATPPPAAPGALFNGTCASASDAALLADNHRLRTENEQLRQALAGRPVIDQARGMLMAMVPCTEARAWELLVDVSQHCNIKLRDVAAALVATTEDRPLPEGMRREFRRLWRNLRAHATEDGVRPPAL
ncbi:ANTAR domain-containing protein [Streptomyces sp. NPDC002564]|uniref:ANTAR domain-containing protein n=1 Tax=Streptomyces sp. NPDC002564 TaxID=3364649 RepID=UPI00368B576D